MLASGLIIGWLRPLRCPHVAQARGKLHKAVLQHILEGSLADVMKAALVCTHTALRRARLPGRSGAPPHDAQVALVVGHSIVVHVPAALPGGQGACRQAGTAAADAAAAFAAAVLPGLRSLYVGRASLSAPPGVRLTAGPSLHLYHQQPVRLPASAAVAAP